MYKKFFILPKNGLGIVLLFKKCCIFVIGVPKKPEFCQFSFSPMKLRIILFILLASAVFSVFAQRVCSVPHGYSADIKVYVTDKEYRADLVVFRTDKEYRAGKNENKGIWYFTDRSYNADKKIFFTDREYQADLVIFFTDKEYRAGWRKAAKKYLMY